jgi:t-SNARE complex subunit (syntaxin)
MTGEENKGAPRRKRSDANLLLTNSRISEAVSVFVQNEVDEIEKDLAKFNEQINQIENAKIQRSSVT